MGITVINVTSEETLTSAIFGDVVRCAGASNYNLTLPTAVGNSGESLLVQMSPALAAVVTLKGKEGQTIGGAATRQMIAGEAVTLVSDGSNYQILYALKKQLTACIRSAEEQAIEKSVETKITHNAVEVDTSGGLMVPTTAFGENHGIYIVRTGTYDVSICHKWVALVEEKGRMYSWAAPGSGDYASNCLVECETTAASDGGAPYVTASNIKPVPLTAGETVYHWILQETAKTRKIYGTAHGATCFLAVKETS